VWKSTNQRGIQCGNYEIKEELKEELKEEIKVDSTNQRGIQSGTQKIQVESSGFNKSKKKSKWNSKIFK
jgi:hypothetical protein